MLKSLLKMTGTVVNPEAVVVNLVRKYEKKDPFCLHRKQ
jgi:hypothetical protein